MRPGFWSLALATVAALGLVGAVVGAVVALVTGWVAAVGIGIAIGGAVAAVVIVLREEEPQLRDGPPSGP